MWLAIANSQEGDKEQHLVKKKFIVVDYNINNKNNGNNTIKVIGGWNSGSYNIVISS